MGEASAIGHQLVAGDVEIADGRVAAVGCTGAGRGFAAPGFIDLQVNGFAGVDFLSTDVDGYRVAGRALLRTGVTAYLPTLSTAEESALAHALDVGGRALRADGAGARHLGIHLEGPFLSPLHAGVHPPMALRAPDVALLRRFLDAGPVAVLTLAPELPGASELIDLAVSRGVVVSLGHTHATAAEADAAFDRGARTVTHLFNGMRSFGHRDPGVVGAALARDDVIVQAILDHVHLAPETGKIVWRAARGRLCLVTDAIGAAGMGDGTFRIGTTEIVVRNGRATGPEGRIGGGTTPLVEAVRNLVRFGASLPEAIAPVTETPARLLRRSDVGSLEVGGRADIVVLDEEVRVLRVLRDGVDVA
jgi:N-acetylglucosamine-6-phosphate deacetylase